MRKQHWVLLMDGIRKNAEKAKNEQAAMIAVMPANGIISIAFLIGALPPQPLSEPPFCNSWSYFLSIQPLGV